MKKSSAPNASFDTDAPGAPGAGTGEPVLGDADAVQGTTYVVGKGTDERNEQRPAKRSEEEPTQPPRVQPPRRGTAADDA